jgi:hypothetical protein
LNWVLLVGGLIPLWTVIMIVYMNRSTSRPRPPRPVEAEPDYDVDYEPAEEEPKVSRMPKLRKVNLGLLRNIGSKLPFRKKRKAQRQAAEPEETSTPMEDAAPKPQMAQTLPALSLDLGTEKTMWGVTLLVLAGACLMNGLYLALDYVFREYRTVLGMRLPMAGALQAASSLSLVVLGLCVVASAAKTGLKLLRG